MITKNPETCTCEDYKVCVKCPHYDDCGPYSRGMVTAGIIAIFTITMVLILLIIK